MNAVNEFFASVKADLTDRRLLPAVAAVCALLVGALAYALLGGGSSSPSSPSVPPVPSVVPSKGIAVTDATANTAVAETTDGASAQAQGMARDPFAALPGSEATTTPSTSPTPSSTPSSSSSTPASSGSEGSGGSGSESSGSSNEGSSNEEQSQPKRPKTVYDVTVKFGTLPPAITPETADLHEYKNLRLSTLLPAPDDVLLAFRGVTPKGRSATFTLVNEAIPSGAGLCLPSALQCLVVNLKVGETEQFSVVKPSGEAVLYELRVLSIEPQKTKASGAAASAASRRGGGEEWGVSRVGQELLRKAHLVAMPFLRYSSQQGVLVFTPKKPKTAHHASQG